MARRFRGKRRYTRTPGFRRYNRTVTGPIGGRAPFAMQRTMRITGPMTLRSVYGKIYRNAIKDRTNVKLTYSETLFSNAIAAISQPAVVAYNMNNIFDPQRQATNWSSATGHQNNGQPLYRDQWSNFYNQYRINACSISVEWQPTDTSPGTIVVYGDDAVCADSDIEVTRERRGARSKCYGTGVMTQRVKVKKTMRVCDVLSMQPREYEYSPLTSALVGTGPALAQAGIYNVVVENTNNTALNGYLRTVIHYYVTYFDPNEDIAGS